MFSLYLLITLDSFIFLSRGATTLVVMTSVEIVIYVFYLLLNPSSFNIGVKKIINIPYLLFLIGILIINIPLAVVISGNVQEGLALASRGVRNLLLAFVGITAYIATREVKSVKLYRLFAFFVILGFTRAAVAMALLNGIEALLLIGVGVSYYSLISIYLMFWSRSLHLKGFWFTAAFVGNSLTSFASMFFALALFKPLRYILLFFFTITGMTIYLNWSYDAKIFRKDLDTILSGTGRFQIYENCISRFPSLSGEECHNSYLTLISYYGYIGIVEISLFLLFFFAYILKYSGVRKMQLLCPIFAILVFVGGNDFLFITPSILTSLFFGFCLFAHDMRGRI